MQRKQVGGIYEGLYERQTIIRPNGTEVIREVYSGDLVTGFALYLKHKFLLERVEDNVWKELHGTENFPLESQY